MSRLGPDQRPTCLIATSIDCVVPNEAKLPRLRSTLTENGHIAISLLWVWQTDIKAINALHSILQPLELCDWHEALETTRLCAEASHNRLSLLHPDLREMSSYTSKAL